MNITSRFLEPIWLYALFLLVPFILLYLFKPKPMHKIIPTVMFLFKDQGKSSKSNFLRRFVQDVLFFLQIIVLAAILISVAKPFINVSKESLFKNTVIVIDASASMKADYQGGTRFEEAINIAKDNLGKTNTLIVVKKTPEIALVEQSSGEIKNYLRTLEPTDTTTNLYDAISAAGGYAKSDSRIIVISDFIDTETDTGVITAKKTLEAQGIKVDFMQVFEKVSNVGIIDLEVDEKKTSAIIKNYNSEEANIQIKVGNLKDNLIIAPDSQEIFTFSTPPDTSKVELTVSNDGFETDNIAYISALSNVKKRILFITNNDNYKKTYLFNVFDVMNHVTIEVAIPPKIPDLGSYDLFVFKDVDPNLILPGTFKGVKTEVEKGKSVIIASQSNILNIDYQGLFPLIPRSMNKKTTNILPSSSDSITENIDFGIIKKYLNTSLIEGRIPVVLAATDDNNPLITFSNLKEGKIVYYGILDEDQEAESIFGKSPSYYVFWKKITDFITDTPSIKTLNYQTGSILRFNEEQTIQTPNGRIKTNQLSLENTGLYTFNNKVIAINLLNEKESDINNENGIKEEGIAQSSDKFKEKVPYELTDYLIIIAIIFLFLELIYVKLRGDF